MAAGLCATAAMAGDDVLVLRTPAGEVALGAAAIVVAVGTGSDGGTALFLRLEGDGRVALGSLTEGAVGSVMEVVVCGAVVAAPVVQAAIEGGVIMIPMPDAGRVAALEGRGACP